MRRRCCDLRVVGSVISLGVCVMFLFFFLSFFLSWVSSFFVFFFFCYLRKKCERHRDSWIFVCAKVQTSPAYPASLFVSVCLCRSVSVSLSVCLSVSLCLCLCLCLSLSLSVCLSVFFSYPVYLPITDTLSLLVFRVTSTRIMYTVFLVCFFFFFHYHSAHRFQCITSG